jgi:hypothetical protein
MVVSESAMYIISPAEFGDPDIRSPRLCLNTSETHIAERYRIAAWDCMKFGNIASRALSKVLH